MKTLIDKLEKQRDLTDQEFMLLLESEDRETMDYLAARARAVCDSVYGRDVYIRGLIEISSYCRNNCLYCGIRRGNANAERYRLTPEQILSCADTGYALGFRTFVLQGGEDAWFTDDRMADIVSELKQKYPECAVTLSLGERSFESYRRLREAGADRYLLRHETADSCHYAMLHPEEMSWENRMECLRSLRTLGYQVGCGMMIGSPFQKTEHLVRDLRFIQSFKPEMVGMGPFIPHKDTPFRDCPAGTLEMTLKLLSIVRLLLPEVLLPATTALGTIHPMGREMGVKAGANVVMPNLSPSDVRGKYLLYDGKICTGDEAAECIRCLSLRMEGIGYHVVQSRGDHISRTERRDPDGQ